VASAGADGSLRLWEVSNGALFSILIGLADGWVCLAPQGGYKVEGATAGQVWFAAALCRFEAGEADPYVSALRRLPLDVPLPPQAPRREP
jgi:hypothetical protein